MSVEYYLAFDVGTKRTGIAIANNLTNIVRGITSVKHHKDGRTNWKEIDKVVNTYPISIFIVGIPLYKNNTQEMLLIAHAFGRKLIARYQKRVIYIDEYLSSYEARKQLKWHHLHHNAKHGAIDKRASMLILQTWLNEINKTS